MMGDFINRILILTLGYAYPAFECYKTLEKNKVDIEELLFWCKYWDWNDIAVDMIIMAQFTVLEKFTDIFIGWLPMYGLMKVVLFVYLWYPKTKGTGYVYETVLGPYVSRLISHEHDIDMKLLELKATGWDYVIYYWKYCTKFWQSAFVKALQHLASQSSGLSTNPTTEKTGQSVPQSPPNQTQSSFIKQTSTLSKSNKLPSSTPSDTQNSKTVEVHYLSQSEYMDEEEEEMWEPKSVTIKGQD